MKWWLENYENIEKNLWIQSGNSKIILYHHIALIVQSDTPQLIDKN